MGKTFWSGEFLGNLAYFGGNFGKSFLDTLKVFPSSRSTHHRGFRRTAISSLGSNGNLHGFFERYFETGQLEARVEYKEGLKDGVHETYYVNGRMEEKVTYENGKPNGIWELYNQNGKLIETRVYEKGEEVKE